MELLISDSVYHCSAVGVTHYPQRTREAARKHLQTRGICNAALVSCDTAKMWLVLG
jgi:hypothetical protein